MRKLIAAGFSILLLQGCSSSPAGIEVGMTTTEVASVLGEPRSVEVEGDATVHEYFNGKKFIPLYGITQKDVEVTFKDDRVVAYRAADPLKQVNRQLEEAQKRRRARQAAFENEQQDRLEANRLRNQQILEDNRKRSQEVKQQSQDLLNSLWGTD